MFFNQSQSLLILARYVHPTHVQWRRKWSLKQSRTLGRASSSPSASPSGTSRRWESQTAQSAPPTRASWRRRKSRMSARFARPIPVSWRWRKKLQWKFFGASPSVQAVVIELHQQQFLGQSPLRRCLGGCDFTSRIFQEYLKKSSTPFNGYYEEYWQCWPGSNIVHYGLNTFKNYIEI